MCGEIPSVSEARRSAKVVFRGTAVGSEYLKGGVFPDGKDAGEQLAVRFQVERWWKGSPLAGEIVVFTDQYRAPDQSVSISTCGMEYVIGREYLVYAVEYTFDGKLRAAYCSRTSETKDAKEDLKKLGKGSPPKTVKATQ